MTSLQPAQHLQSKAFSTFEICNFGILKANGTALALSRANPQEQSSGGKWRNLADLGNPKRRWSHGANVTTRYRCRQEMQVPEDVAGRWEAAQAEDDGDADRQTCGLGLGIRRIPYTGGSHWETQEEKREDASGRSGKMRGEMASPGPAEGTRACPIHPIS